MNPDDLAARTATDSAFRAALLADPKAALAEVGVPVPDGVEVEIVESTPQVWRLAIPPAETDDQELDEDALAGVAGGNIITSSVRAWGLVQHRLFGR